MIISGGVNIYPREIEDVLIGHPEVLDVAVIGVPDDEMGERLLAVVEASPGVTPDADLAAELQQHCREHLAGFKCPREVTFVDELPRLPTGQGAQERAAPPARHVVRRCARRRRPLRRESGSASPLSDHRPCQTGGRFSMKAVAPSLASSLPKTLGCHSACFSHAWPASVTARRTKLLRGLQGQRPVAGDALGHADTRFEHLVRRHDVVHQAQRLGAAGIDVVTGERHLQRRPPAESECRA